MKHKNGKISYPSFFEKPRYFYDKKSVSMPSDLLTRHAVRDIMYVESVSGFVCAAMARHA